MSVNVTRVVKFRRKPAVLRGPQAWSDCADGYSFQSGGDGDEWKDVVMYGDNFYSCMVNHSKTPTNYPGSSDDQANGYWRLGDKIELVATKLLLAQYALVKNLGVECVDMKDAEGNIVFRAKDGEVICENGKFINASVFGDITAMNMTYRMDNTDHSLSGMISPPIGAVCRNVSVLQLPQLPKGHCKIVRVLNDDYVQDAGRSLRLIPMTENVYIKAGPYDQASKEAVLPSYGPGSGKLLDLLGYHDTKSENTYWLLSERKFGITYEDNKNSDIWQ